MATSMSTELSEGEAVTFEDLVHLNKNSLWDPELSSDWDVVKPSEQCFLRVKRDIMSVYKDPTPGMCIVPDKEDMTKLHALITGPFDTPYEGGFFYFVIRCPPDYPIKPPRVKLMTTGGGTVRFNPNLYKNGKVCLSILGTWSGPGWSPANSISSVLISIQSLMNEKPYHNEPGFERERVAGDAKRYNEIIRHETLRVSVCEMLGGSEKCPETLRDVMKASFGSFYDYYVTTCKSNMHINAQPMQDPFGEKRGIFNYKSILDKLEKLKDSFGFEESDSESDLDTTSDSESDKSEDTQVEKTTEFSKQITSSTAGNTGSLQGDTYNNDSSKELPSSQDTQKTQLSLNQGPLYEIKHSGLSYSVGKESNFIFNKNLSISKDVCSNGPDDTEQSANTSNKCDKNNVLNIDSRQKDTRNTTVTTSSQNSSNDNSENSFYTICITG